MLGAPLLFAVELAILYAAGTYAMGRLIGLSGFGGGGSALGRVAFYVLVFAGVVLHEGAHYLACVLTGTKVTRFAPFSPGRSNDGRLLLGYVRHERRVFPVGAMIGLAPILLNPLGLLLVTALGSDSITPRPSWRPRTRGRRACTSTACSTPRSIAAWRTCGRGRSSTFSTPGARWIGYTWLFGCWGPRRERGYEEHA